MKHLDLVILAGGLGSRIKNITKKKPKPLIKFGKLSFLKNLLNYFAKYNFNKIYIIAGYKGDLIKDTFHNKIINLTKVECILEKKLKGTGGALNELKKKKIKNFILSNGDSFCPINLNHFIKDLGNKLIKVSLVKNQNYKQNNLLANLNVKKEKIIFDKKSPFMNSGIYYVNKKNLKYFNAKKFSFENNYLKNLIIKKKVYGEKYKNELIDIGTPQNLKIAKRKLPKIFKKPAIFLDRDGVINYDYGYVHKMDNFKLRSNVIKGLKYLNKLNYYIFIITNQSGIARGYYTENQFIEFQKNINENFTNKDIFINDTLYCPHHVNGKIKKYSISCNCRKPNTLMLKKINNTFDLDLKKSLFIGDKVTDMKCAKKLKIKFCYARLDFYDLIKKTLNKI